MLKFDAYVDVKCEQALGILQEVTSKNIQQFHEHNDNLARMKNRVICLILEKSTTNFSIVIDNNKVSDDGDDGDGILENLQTMWRMVDVAQMHTQDLLDGYEVRGIQVSQ